MGEFPQGAAGQTSPDHQRQQIDPNTSMKTEYMSFPPPLQRSPLNATTEREYVHHLCVCEVVIYPFIPTQCWYVLFSCDPF